MLPQRSTQIEKTSWSLHHHLGKGSILVRLTMGMLQNTALITNQGWLHSVNRPDEFVVMSICVESISYNTCIVIILCNWQKFGRNKMNSLWSDVEYCIWLSLSQPK